MEEPRRAATSAAGAIEIEDGDYCARSRWPWCLPIVVILVGTAVYHNSFSGTFLFDDTKHILANRVLAQLRAPWEILSTRRPVLNLSLAINHALGGFNTWGYHLVNLAVHILAALALFGVVRRTLLQEPLRARFAHASPWLAGVVALIWLVHPLQTQSVTYIIQRGEALMGLFYLLTFYCVIRGVHAARRWAWYVAAWMVCALGMGSKAVMVTAPLMVLLYDRAVLCTTWGEVARKRWALYLGLGVSWGVLWACGIVPGVLRTQPHPAAHVGFAYAGITPSEYALTQPGVLVHYLKLSLWPRSLCLDYDWPVAQTAGAILPPLLAVVALLTAAGWALIRKPPLGFVGAWFFLILAPTSSFVPIKDPAFEHRMYLPLAAVVALLVIGGHYVLGRLSRHLSVGLPLRRLSAAGLVFLVVVSLGYSTIQRNKDYQGSLTMWSDVVAKRPDNARAHHNLGNHLRNRGQLSEAIRAYREAVRIRPWYDQAYVNLGLAFAGQGKLNDAIGAYREALRINPRYVLAHINLGVVLERQGKLDEATSEYRDALQMNPRSAEAHNNLGTALRKQGRLDEAIEHFREALRIRPLYAAAHINLGIALGARNQLDSAVKHYRAALRISPRDALACINLGVALEQQEKLDEAIEQYREALRIRPAFAEAHYNLGNALKQQGKTEEAIKEYRQALRANPALAQAYYNLGNVLNEQGNTTEAVEEYRKTLRLNPNHTGARKALDAALAEQQRLKMENGIR